MTPKTIERAQLRLAWLFEHARQIVETTDGALNGLY
jgi:hypothetical protein